MCFYNTVTALPPPIAIILASEMFHRFNYSTVMIIFALVVLAELSSAQYLEIYPDETTGDPETKHLYFGLMQSFGGGADVRQNVAGAQVALEQINKDPTMLPGYTLHYTLSDAQVSY